MWTGMHVHRATNRNNMYIGSFSTFYTDIEQHIISCVVTNDTFNLKNTSCFISITYNRLHWKWSSLCSLTNNDNRHYWFWWNNLFWNLSKVWFHAAFHMMPLKKLHTRMKSGKNIGWIPRTWWKLKLLRNYCNVKDTWQSSR